jgi:hypothetical protein
MELRNVVYVHNGVLFSHKKNEIMLFAGKLIELTSNKLSKVSQAQKVKDHMFSQDVETTYKLNVCINTYTIVTTYL